ncbi:MAG: bifunctional (p)ppGpp synthetase/guanosine-3',5'-bis(diphosphate) 3'-pyrophosphohydrolase [Ruminococcaceae bacterium]|nr:bifunctional (p)ppGpp synthetase/guanosine-3',5'-bis(diphosphate) 3'-pyrophosphohydrolase [Oscillospiraceae bacterium]
MYFDELSKLIENSGRQYDMVLIKRAYDFAESRHGGQYRKSGEDYISHPVYVASLLVDLGLDSESLAAALLHDVAEDTETEISAIEKEFGEEITSLVNGVTKLGEVPYSSVEEEQAENIRKLLLAMSKDIRVMIIKLCDRLHNMRTADFWEEQKRRDKALETMEVYAPIAHRLGMTQFKEELEDLSLAYLDPIGYKEILDVLSKRDMDSTFVEEISNTIIERLKEVGIKNPLIESRIKSKYGIYNKLIVQNRSIEEIFDIYAIRVILDEIGECYNALGILHDAFRPIPQRFKDYISTPKPNGYRSLHTTVIVPGGIPFEIQIRTHEMHYNAEYGIAAHWKYKSGIKGKDKLEERLAWLRQLLESQKESEDSLDILRDIKSDLVPEEVYVFTPKGDVINLPTGSTVIDFAYSIHSAVGNRMIGAKVSGRIVPITYVVKTGDFIEILTGPADKGPSRDWLNIVKTSEAKSKIRSWFKKEKKEENIIEGKSRFEKELRRNLINIPQDKMADFTEEVAKRQKFPSAEEMYAAIGYGGVNMSRILPKAKDEYAKMIKQDDPHTIFKIPESPKNKSAEGVIVEGIDNCLTRFAKCCNPLPGDEIVGFITRGQGVSIHKKDCKNASVASLGGGDSPRWIKARWSDNVKETFRATLEIISQAKNGYLANITTALSNMRVPIFSMNAKTTQDKRATIIATIGIDNTEHLKTVMTKLMKVPDVQHVERLNK